MSHLINALYFFLLIYFTSSNIFANEVNLDVYNNKINLVLTNDENYICELPNKFQHTDITKINIFFENSDAWFLNFAKALKSKKNSISSRYKKKFNASLSVTYNNKITCVHKARIRISGDHKDHLRDDWLSSLDISLLNGNINNITKFKLFLPETRNNQNEIFSTLIFKELGFLAPSTSLIDVSINSNSSKYIFQEKIVKEFFERNFLREGAVIEFDERFMFGDKVYINQRTDYLGFYRISNESWISKSNNNYLISKNILSFINSNLINYHTQLEKSFNEHKIFFDKENIINTNLDLVKEYGTLLWALNGQHGLRPSNRKFYYDNINNKFYPIYYDGDSTILDYNNYDFNRAKNIPSIQSNFAESIIQKIKLINKKNFREKLIKHNIQMNIFELNNIFKKIIKNLEEIKNIKYKSFYEFNDEYKLKINSFSNKKRINKIKFVFTKKDNNELFYCDYDLNNCNDLEINFNQKVDLVNQKFKNEFFEFIYVGDYEKIIRPSKGLNNTFFSINNLNQINFDNFTIVYDDTSVRLKIDKKNKKILVNQINFNPRILFKGKFLEDWTINYVGDLNLSDVNTKSDIYSLTGCVTFANIQIKNINIVTENSVCEDAVNFLHVIGEDIMVTSKNSLFDSLDADFSKIIFSEINIKNSKNDCIDLSWGEYYLLNTNTAYCGDKALSIGEKSIVFSKKISILNSNIGIANKDSSLSFFNNIKMNEIDTCLAAYNKKQEFNNSYTEINNIECSNYLSFKDSDGVSIIKIDNVVE